MRARLLALLLAVSCSAAAEARTILFIGNSFTFGAGSPVHRYRPDTVTDLNGDGFGGVPALFKAFARQAGFDWEVSLETSPGQTLQWHFDTKKPVIERPWDVVILQGYSTLDPQTPGDPTRHVQYAARLAALMKARNPNVEVLIESTWSRADQTYLRYGHWGGQTIYKMADDLALASAQAVRLSPDIRGAIPVGAAWSRAMRAGIADPNPYDGIAYGKIDLWTYDQYHASAEGYYLAALVIFGRVTGRDPRTFGEREQAAMDLGFNPAVVRQLQQVAWEELQAVRPPLQLTGAAVPLPASRP